MSGERDVKRAADGFKFTALELLEVLQFALSLLHPAFPSRQQKAELFLDANGIRVSLQGKQPFQPGPSVLAPFGYDSGGRPARWGPGLVGCIVCHVRPAPPRPLGGRL